MNTGLEEHIPAIFSFLLHSLRSARGKTGEKEIEGGLCTTRPRFYDPIESRCEGDGQLSVIRFGVPPTMPDFSKNYRDFSFPQVKVFFNALSCLDFTVGTSQN